MILWDAFPLGFGRVDVSLGLKMKRIPYVHVYAIASNLLEIGMECTIRE